jgi:5'-deoxynucleotidase YfbR-like HD superfamily hydrolase
MKAPVMTMQTFLGAFIGPLDAEPGDIDIADIAHGLSLTNRFGGATMEPYSVAQHCVIMSKLVEEDFAMQALLHDAHEYIIGDIVTPTKLALGKEAGDAIRSLKRRMDRVIGEALNVDMDYRRKDVQEADLRMLITEAAQLFRDNRTSHWNVDAAPYDVDIVPWAAWFAEFEFMSRYTELKKLQNCHTS